ncbi:unannotated protein [freshwater metagenome]|uniref:Unannotated protein n=1 Tax=freshwater metagenome TaxID=449393 RepID=A0A6J7S109_9ZZZZ
MPNADSVARVAPINTGATTGNKSSGSNVSRPLAPAARPPYRVPTAAKPQVAAIAVVTKSTPPSHEKEARYNTTAAPTNSATKTISCTIRASILPMKIPMAGTPADRSWSSAPSAVSTANDRETMTSTLKRVASQTSPGATRSSTASLSRAKANMTITMSANGKT